MGAPLAIDALLVVNAGSSSLKAAAFAVGRPGRPARLFHAEASSLNEAGHAGALDEVLAHLAAEHPEVRVVAGGHRVAHGGLRFVEPTLLTPAVMSALGALVPLAPLHLPHNLAGVEAMERAFPGTPQVACFDTAFHRTLPAVARRFALPRQLSDEGVVRYGFHGLSYQHLLRELPAMAGALPGRLVAAHLGQGASLCAIAHGRSVDTTMGLTPLDGVPMGTRCGALDPGVVPYLMATHHLDVAAVLDLLYRQSGLLGVSGISPHMHELLVSPDPRAFEAVEIFVYRVVREIGALAGALGGLDALVFTGGIGERSAEIRERVLRRCAWLGVELDVAANATGGPRLTRPGSAASAWVVPCDEESEIAGQVSGVLARLASGSRGPQRATDDGPGDHSRGGVPPLRIVPASTSMGTGGVNSTR